MIDQEKVMEVSDSILKSPLFKETKLFGVISWWDTLTPKEKLIRRSIHEYILCLSGLTPAPLRLEDL